jgi:squalene synthase HpnC
MYSKYTFLILISRLKNSNPEISHVYKSAIDFAKNHYENFPVVSWFIPKDLRKHVAIIYWFARTADDFSDEGNHIEEHRLMNLNGFEKSLSALLNGEFKSPFEEALHNTINQKKLTPQLFYDLLKAFKQDVTKKRYENFAEVLAYCQYSANPVGRLILELFDIRINEAFNYSDKICTALQLTNFYQDIEIDYEKGRIYLPIDEMQKYDVTENMFAKKENNVNLKKLLAHNIERTQKMYDEGKNLLNYMSGRLKFEIKWTILGGESILNKIRLNDYNIFNARPKLTKIDFGSLFIKSFFS